MQPYIIIKIWNVCADNEIEAEKRTKGKTPTFSNISINKECEL